MSDNQFNPDQDCEDYGQSLCKHNTIFVDKAAQVYTLKHVTKSNYYCAIGRFKKEDGVFWFHELKDPEKEVRIVTGRIDQSFRLYNYLEQVSNDIVLVKGQLCKLFLSGDSYEFEFGLCPYAIEVNPCDYEPSRLIVSLGFVSWNKKKWDHPSMDALVFSDILDHFENKQILKGIKTPSWMLSYAETQPDWLKNCFILAECSLLGCWGIEIDKVLAIVNPDDRLGDTMFDCQFMLQESMRQSVSGFAWFDRKMQAHTFSLSGQREQLVDAVKETTEKKKTKRKNISDRLRRRVLERDNFTCCDCGASPQKDPNVELHIDHRIPVSKGGKNIEANLQTLCKSCNLGKGIDLDWKLGSKEVPQGVAA